MDGCTNPNAENYNSAATFDDGSCTLARAKFIGAYNISEDCNGTISIYSMTISEEANNENGIYLENFGNIAATVIATVNGNNITFDDTQSSNVHFVGTGTLAGTILSIDYTATQGTTIEYSCIKTGTKQ